jgi:hypothetical protein
VKDEDFDRRPDADPSQQVDPESGRHNEIEPQQKRRNTGEDEYRELNRAGTPANVPREMADGALDIEC